MQWFKVYHYSVSVYITWSLPLKGYPAPVFHGLCCWNKSSVENQAFFLFFFFFSAGVVSGTTRLALQDWWGLDRTALLTVESRWTSHSQHHWVPCKCEVSVRMVARIHVLRSVFMHKLVWFQLLLACKEGEPENSQTPEPFLTTPTTPPTTITRKIHVFSLISSLRSS